MKSAAPSQPAERRRQLADAAGVVVDSYVYTAYGYPVAWSGTDPNPFRYGGQFGYYTDTTAWPAGLILCGARWYDPYLGRWTSRDPIGYGGGANLYEYCGGEPVGKVDPTGLNACSPSERRRLVEAINTIDWLGASGKHLRRYRDIAADLRRLLGGGQIGVDPRLSSDTAGYVRMFPLQPRSLTAIQVNPGLLERVNSRYRVARRENFRRGMKLASILVHEYQHYANDGWFSGRFLPNVTEATRWMQQATFLLHLRNAVEPNGMRQAVLGELWQWAEANCRVYRTGKEE